MFSLTLNYSITQLRCRVLPNGIEYEAMINNHWQPVTHQFAKIMWDNYRIKKRALVKINSLSYIEKALAKSSVEFRSSLEKTNAHNRALCGFFVHNAQIHPFNGGLGGGAERLAGFVCAGTANLAQFTSISFAALVVSFINSQTRAVFMTTIPNEIVSDKTISINQIDKINKNLIQAEAILHLLSINSRSEIQINNKLVCDALWVISDLVANARYFLHNDNIKEVDL